MTPNSGWLIGTLLIAQMADANDLIQRHDKSEASTGLGQFGGGKLARRLAPTARFRPRRDAMRKDAFAEPGCEMAGDRNYEAKKRLCCKDVTGGQNLRV